MPHFFWFVKSVLTKKDFLATMNVLCLSTMKRSELLLMILQVPLDFLLLLLAAVSAYALRFSDWVVDFRPVLFDLSLTDFLELAIPVAVGWIIIFALAGLYAPDPNRKLGDDLVRILLACSTGLAAIALFLLFTQQLFDSRFLAAAGWGSAILFISLGRLLVRGIKALLYRSDIGLRRVAVIGDGPLAEGLLGALKKRRELGYTVIANPSRFSDAEASLFERAGLDEVICVSPRGREEEALRLLEWCNRRHITFKYSADLFATLTANTRVVPLAGIPIIELRRTRLDGWGRVAKRLFDLVLGLFFLFLSAPIMALASLGILFETNRPIIYKNERVGWKGRHFFTLKFRSMYQKDSTGVQFGASGKRAEKREERLIVTNNVRQGPIYKIVNDPRVSPFGRFLRRWSIDEIPQFWNVVKGEMSLIGPRPHQPREVRHYERQFPHVFDLKPGVTGLAQISGRSDLSFEEEMALDVLYMEKWSILLDCIILLKTPFVVLKKRKAA